VAGSVRSIVDGGWWESMEERVRFVVLCTRGCLYVECGVESRRLARGRRNGSRLRGMNKVQVTVRGRTARDMETNS